MMYQKILINKFIILLFLSCSLFGNDFLKTLDKLPIKEIENPLPSIENTKNINHQKEFEELMDIMIKYNMYKDVKSILKSVKQKKEYDLEYINNRLAVLDLYDDVPYLAFKKILKILEQKYKNIRKLKEEIKKTENIYLTYIFAEYLYKKKRFSLSNQFLQYVIFKNPNNNLLFRFYLLIIDNHLELGEYTSAILTVHKMREELTMTKRQSDGLNLFLIEAEIYSNNIDKALEHSFMHIKKYPNDMFTYPNTFMLQLYKDKKIDNKLEEYFLENNKKKSYKNQYKCIKKLEDNLLNNNFESFFKNFNVKKCRFNKASLKLWNDFKTNKRDF